MTDAPWPFNPNTSATGGTVLPAQPASLPGGLGFEDFIQSMLAGISGLPGSLVRPKWQLEPPKSPDVTVNWMGFGVNEDDADTNAYVDGGNFMRMEALAVQCSFYGPDAWEYTKLLRDGLQIPQNLQALNSAKMGFVSTSRMTRVPDLVNEQWVNRWEMTVFLRREIQRTYPILTFVAGAGTLTTNDAGSSTKTVAIAVD